MRTHLKSGATRVAAVFGGFLLVAAVPVALAADTSGLRSQAAGLRADASSLEARAQAATLELYALETELGRARTALDEIAGRRAEVARERTSARTQLRLTRQALRVSEARLGEIVRALYEQSGQADPLAILLGASSLEEALNSLDNLDRTAGENQRIVERAEAARARLGTLDARLTAKEAELARLATAARERAQRLEAAAATRRAFVAGLRRQQGLNAARVSAIERQVRAAEARTVTIQAASPPLGTATLAVPAAPEAASAPLAGPAGSGATLTVSATAYALRGRTATGIQTAPGVVAVDPSVIPLGTRMTIPGYGIGIAADTGGAVQGNVIDVWFPTTAQALAWGRRTVTITLH
ncbi:MAG TPA: 3D domain-containing protein [Gaiellaceae bacterium]|nr:3D domain-containing protein [Gaiellaceae bacterium]